MKRKTNGELEKIQHVYNRLKTEFSLITISDYEKKICHTDRMQVDTLSKLRA
jgi:hypothetical protein